MRTAPSTRNRALRRRWLSESAIPLEDRPRSAAGAYAAERIRRLPADGIARGKRHHRLGRQAKLATRQRPLSRECGLGERTRQVSSPIAGGYPSPDRARQSCCIGILTLTLRRRRAHDRTASSILVRKHGVTATKRPRALHETGIMTPVGVWLLLSGNGLRVWDLAGRRGYWGQLPSEALNVARDARHVRGVLGLRADEVW
jgi:hypothetical protein